MFNYINSHRIRCYLANLLTLGIYGAIYIALNAHRTGKLSGKKYPEPTLSIVLMIVSLGIYTGVMLSILAFNLGKLNLSNVGLKVFILNIASLITAFMPGGIFLFISIALWIHAFWLLVDVENTVLQNNSLKIDAVCARA